MPDGDAPDRDHVRVRLELDWRPLGEVLLVDDRLQFPVEAPKVAGVYRFSLRADTGGDTVYIGEGELLNKRFGWYRGGHGSQVTNKRMNDCMKDVLTSRGTVMVDVATEIRLEVDGQPVPSDLAKAFQRKLAENAALVAAGVAGEKIENKSKES